jgi:hypothetical protein
MHAVFFKKVPYYLEEGSMVATRIRDEDSMNYESSINGHDLQGKKEVQTLYLWRKIIPLFYNPLHFPYE